MFSLWSLGTIAPCKVVGHISDSDCDIDKYSETSLARQTRLLPCQCPGRISCHAFYLVKPLPSPLAIATTWTRLTPCKLTSITRHYDGVGCLSTAVISPIIPVTDTSQGNWHPAAAAAAAWCVSVVSHPLVIGPHVVRREALIYSVGQPRSQCH